MKTRRLSTSLLAVCASAALSLALAIPQAPEAVADQRVLAGPGLTGVVPQVQNFEEGSGSDFFLTSGSRIIVSSEDMATLGDEAELLASELVALDLAEDLGWGPCHK